MSFRLVPKSVTSSDLERRSGTYFALFHRIRVRCCPKSSRSLSRLLMSFLLPFFLLFHPFPFYQNRTTPFPGRRSQEATEAGFSLFLVFCVDFVLYVFLVKDTCLFFVVFDLVLSCGVIVVSHCCRRYRKNLSEPLDSFPFLGGC